MNNIILILIIILIPFAIGWFSYAPWVPTRKEDIERAIWLIEFIWKNVFFELGCWDWRTCFEVAKRYDIEVTWIEINIFMYLICILKKMIFYRKLKNVRFVYGSLFKINLKGVDIIYTFWMPEKMWKLAVKIKKECQKWTQVISYAFGINWLENEIKDKPSKDMLSIFCYKI